MLRASVWITEIEFSDDTKITFDKQDIIVFVGPNNAGKSASLKEAASMLRAKNNNGKVIKNLKFEKQGDTDQFMSFLESFSRKTFSSNPLPNYLGFNFNVYEANAKNHWNSNNGFSELTSVFVNTLTTEDRLKAVNPPSSINLVKDAPKHPIHFLQKNELEAKFSNYFHQAFGADLIVNRNAGNIVPLYVGRKPIPKDGEDRVSAGYLEELEKLDLLHEQGDGMRSFVKCFCF